MKTSTILPAGSFVNDLSPNQHEQVPPELTLRCYVQTPTSYTHALAYTSTSIKDFLKHAAAAHREARKNIVRCDGAFFTVTSGGEEMRIVGFLGTGGSKFYQYIGQGSYFSRALGPKTLEKFAKDALVHGETLKQAMDNLMEFNKKHNPHLLKQA